MYKKTIKDCPVPLDISLKSNRKHHKTVLYSKSNKNMVGRLFGRFFIVFGRFFNRNIWSPWGYLTIDSDLIMDIESEKEKEEELRTEGGHSSLPYFH